MFYETSVPHVARQRVQYKYCTVDRAKTIAHPFIVSEKGCLQLHASLSATADPLLHLTFPLTWAGFKAIH